MARSHKSEITLPFQETGTQETRPLRNHSGTIAIDVQTPTPFHMEDTRCVPRLASIFLSLHRIVWTVIFISAS